MTRVGELFRYLPLPSSDASVTMGGVASLSEKLDRFEFEASELRLISSFWILPWISLLPSTSTY